MRRFFVGLVGFAVIAFAASLCYADDGETEGLKYSLDLNKLFGSTFQEEEKAEFVMPCWGQMRFLYSNGTYSVADGRPVGGNEQFETVRFRFLPKVTYKWLSFGCQYETDANLTLLDFWANFNCTKYKDKLQLKVGQFIPPFGLQRWDSPYKLLCDYSQVVSYLFGDPKIAAPYSALDPLFASWDNLRDQGMMVHGKVGFGAKKDDFQPSISYGLGLFTGEGANADPANSDPAWTTFATVRVEAVKGVLVGLSFEDGSRFNTADDRIVNRDRFGFCGQLKMSGLIVQTEYIVGDDSPADHVKHVTAPATHNTRRDTDGWYLQVGYDLKPEKVKLIAQVDVLDVPAYGYGDDSRAAHTIRYRQLRQYGLGIIFFFNKHCKMKIFWEQTQNEGRKAKVGGVRVFPKIAGSEHRAFVVLGVNF